MAVSRYLILLTLSVFLEEDLRVYFDHYHLKYTKTKIVNSCNYLNDTHSHVRGYVRLFNVIIVVKYFIN